MKTPDQASPVAKTDATVTTITRKIGLNRGKARLWIEGVALASQGWTKGTTYAPVWNPNARTLEYVRAVSAINVRLRKVAGDSVRPIIDTNTDDLLHTMIVQPGDTVLITITRERILVREFNPATDAKAEAMKGKH